MIQVKISKKAMELNIDFNQFELIYSQKKGWRIEKTEFSNKNLSELKKYLKTIKNN